MRGKNFRGPSQGLIDPQQQVGLEPPSDLDARQLEQSLDAVNAQLA
jgi:hypothetical protein